MIRRMTMPTQMNAVWEIISTAEYINELEREADNDDMVAIYQGNYVPLLLDERTSRKQIWHVIITTIAEHEDGTRHTHEMEWNFDKPMMMKEVLDGAKHIKVMRDGLKVRWTGLAKEWVKTVDQDLSGLTAISAWAVATCNGFVAKSNPLLDTYSVINTKRITNEEVLNYVQQSVQLGIVNPIDIAKRLNANRNYLSIK